MRTFLDKLRELKQNEVSKRQIEINEDHLRAEVNNLEKAPNFRKRLIRNPGEPISLILEVKSRAPGRINIEQLEPETVVKEFEHGGAKAISVLTLSLIHI